MSIAQLSSRINSVKIYAAGATVTRIAQLNMTTSQFPEQVEIAGLPLALDDSSVRVRVESVNSTSLHAADIRIGLAVPPPPETPNPPPDEELRAVRVEVKRIEDAIALIDNEIQVLYQLHVPDRPESEIGVAPPPSPNSARLALANFSDEQIRTRIQERRENLEKLRKAKENLADLQQKQALASTARDARPNELRKTLIVSLSYEGEQPANGIPQLIVEYFVPGARWTPSYVCRLNSAENKATIAVRALICQQTGEDWSGVLLQLSTAMPTTWCGVPELPSRRIGRAQPMGKKLSTRKPPIGAEILFEDFDKQKKIAKIVAAKHTLFTDLSAPEVPPLQNLFVTPQDKAESLNKQSEKESAISEYAVLNSQELDWPDANQELNEAAEFVDLFESSDEEISLFTTETEVEQFAELERMISDNFPKLMRPAPAPMETKKALTQAVSQQNFRSEPDFGVMAGRGVAPSEYYFGIDLTAYSLMRLGAPENPAKRGKLSIEARQKAYLETLKLQKIVVNFRVMGVVQQAISNAEECSSFPLPPGGIDVRKVAGSFDYAYSADGRIDVPSDGQFHSVALTSNSTDVDVRYVVVPREDTNVFRIAQLRNPLQAPLLSGLTDVYVDGEYILSTNINTVPPKGQMELGLGVEQAIKVARNTFYSEVRSGETIVAFNELRHKIQIDIVNHLPREARIEVRERLPIPQAGAKVDVQIDRVSPDWQQYKQEERDRPIQGGYRWRVKVAAKKKTTLAVDYTIKTFVDSELLGGNRRE